MKKRVLPNLLALFVFFYFTVLPFQQFNLNTNDIFGNKNIANTQLVYASTNVSLPENTKDGAILQAFGTTFNNLKAELPQIASAGFKSIQVAPIQGSKANPGDPSTWWNLYQPTNFSIGNSLGSHTDFATLCSEAKNYGIAIIVDVVFNHMANNGSGNQAYHPWSGLDSKYKDDPSVWHEYYNPVGISSSDWDNSRYSVVHNCMGLPDLNTGNPKVQQWELDFLNECVDAGASGFRFDAAKSIETNICQDAGQNWQSNYWDVVLGSGLHNKSSLFIYGEVLQNKADNMAGYTKFMSATASNYSGEVRDAIYNNNVTKANDTTYGGVTPGSAVTYFETHDTDLNNDWCPSRNMNDWQRKMGWAIVAGRAGATPLLYVRFPNTFGGTWGQANTDIWSDPLIVATNKFHNAMVGQSEYLRTPSDKVMIIDRGTIGTEIINLGGQTSVNSPTNLKNGTYTDQGGSGSTFTVSNGQISGNMPGGTAVFLYNPQSIVIASANIKGGSYQTSQNVTLTASTSNASIYYTTNGTTPTAASTKYVSPISISTNTTLKFLAIDGTVQSPVYTETYTIGGVISSVIVHFKNPTSWAAPNIYYYDTTGVNKGPAWPGTKMTSEGNGWYSYTISNWSTAKIIFNDGTNQNPGVNQPGFDVTGEKWYENGTWYSTNPEPVVAVKVHFQKPANWAAPNIYYYDTTGVNKGSAWPGTAMTSEGNGWYSYTIENWSTAKVIFNDGTNQNPGANQPGFDVTGEEWYANGTWYFAKPF